MPTLNDVPQNKVVDVVEMAILADAKEVTVTKQDNNLYTVTWSYDTHS